ncbi:MAG: hypothetical protein HFJ35_03650 [Clostridia bacterium]|nr:hypothetical protein [Clostridia bacterium]
MGVIIKKHSNKFLSFILAFASGLMMAVICFDLIPEAIRNKYNSKCCYRNHCWNNSNDIL